MFLRSVCLLPLILCIMRFSEFVPFSCGVYLFLLLCPSASSSFVVSVCLYSFRSLCLPFCCSLFLHSIVSCTSACLSVFRAFFLVCVCSFCCAFSLSVCLSVCLSFGHSGFLSVFLLWFVCLLFSVGCLFCLSVFCSFVLSVFLFFLSVVLSFVLSFVLSVFPFIFRSVCLLFLLFHHRSFSLFACVVYV